MLKNINPLESFTNMIIPIIINKINQDILVNNLESKLNDYHNRIVELENILYYSPDFGTEYLEAKSRFESMSIEKFDK